MGGPSLQIEPVERKILRLLRFKVAGEPAHPTPLDVDLARPTAHEQGSMTSALRAIRDSVPPRHWCSSLKTNRSGRSTNHTNCRGCRVGPSLCHLSPTGERMMANSMQKVAPLHPVPGAWMGASEEEGFEQREEATFRCRGLERVVAATILQESSSSSALRRRQSHGRNRYRLADRMHQILFRNYPLSGNYLPAF